MMLKKLQRAKIKQGSKEKPRLSVFRSSNHIYAQIIDDQLKKTIVGVTDLKENLKKGRMERAKLVGKTIAEKAIEKKVDQVVFDRRTYRFHGRIKALAQAARKTGLKF
jgi:large subunit ribosomal protein L18